MKNIEEILLLNKNLSYRVLIYNKYSWKNKIITFLHFTLAICLMIIMFIKLIPQKEAVYLLLLIPFLILWIFSSVYNQMTTQKIVQKHYNYALKEEKKWNHKTMLKIRKKELVKLLSNKELLKKENLLFLIEAVKHHNDNKHRFNFLWNALIILSSVYFGGFLGGYVNYSKDLADFLSFYKVFAIIIGVLILLVWYMDSTMIKEVIESNKTAKNRLLVTLENIYIEKYAA